MSDLCGAYNRTGKFERCSFSTLFFIYKNIFYKNIEAESLKRIDIILCVETFVNTVQFYVFNLNLIKQALLVNKEFTAGITLDYP